MRLSLYGVRHHGPGSARSLLAALEAAPPDVLLVEGPPDADELLPLVTDPELRAPVALLVHPSEEPALGVFYPLADFSPELVAMRWAVERGIPVRFCDLPIAHRGEAAAEDEPPEVEARLDPIATLAATAGWPDPERYWEHLVEQRSDAGVFEAIALAMTEIRAAMSPSLIPDDRHEARREAWMRRTIRAAGKTHEHVAVVCGAWHVPALAAAVPVRDDDARLKELPRRKVEACWVPWSLGRLSRWSGYGAGVSAPGWYAHLWAEVDDPITTWVVASARALRDAGQDASPASATEAVRLAHALAGLRGAHAPDLDTLDDAVLAVLCGGQPTRLALIQDKLAHRDQLGAIPAHAPQPPLLRDVYAEAKRLRLKIDPAVQAIELDLRKDTDRARSALFHRLTLLGVPWARPGHASGRGTFKEAWSLAWEPMHALTLVEASPLGHTVEAAAVGHVLRVAKEAASLPDLAELLSRALVAGLDRVIDPVLDALEALAVRVADPSPLLAALPALGDALRYGDVRGTQATRVAPVFRGLLDRALIALVPGSTSLDDDAAEALAAALRGTQAVLIRQEDPGVLDAWDAALADLLTRDRHGRLLGTATRLRLDRERLDDAALEHGVSYALSGGHPPEHGAHWLSGLLAGGGATLLHRDVLWTALDAWLVSLADDTFVVVLPSLRRAFADFPAPERARMAERLAQGRAPVARSTPLDELVDPTRADRVLPVLALWLGGAA